MEGGIDGVKEDFAEFYRREYPRCVRNLVMSGFEEQVAKDSAQKAMIDAYPRWDQLINPTAWVRTAARHYAKHAEEQDRRRWERDTRYLQRAYPALGSSAEQGVEWKEEARSILQLISAMPPRRQTVVALAFDGWKADEIAQEIGMDQSTVRSHLRHARRALEQGGKWPEGGTS